MSTICFIYSFSYYPPFQRGIMMWYITPFILWKKENRLPVVSLINFISIPFIFSFQCPKVYFISSFEWIRTIRLLYSILYTSYSTTYGSISILNWSIPTSTITSLFIILLSLHQILSMLIRKWIVAIIWNDSNLSSYSQIKTQFFTIQSSSLYVWLFCSMFTSSSFYSFLPLYVQYLSLYYKKNPTKEKYVYITNLDIFQRFCFTHFKSNSTLLNELSTMNSITPIKSSDLLVYKYINNQCLALLLLFEYARIFIQSASRINLNTSISTYFSIYQNHQLSQFYSIQFYGLLFSMYTKLNKQYILNTNELVYILCSYLFDVYFILCINSFRIRSLLFYSQSTNWFLIPLLSVNVCPSIIILLIIQAIYQIIFITRCLKSCIR